MLIQGVDLPFRGPQVLAFALPWADLKALRGVLRLAMEAGDAAPLAALWTARLEHYRATAPGIRWQAPESELQELAVGLREVQRLTQQGWPAGNPPPDAGTLEALQQTVQELLHSGDRVHPGPWFKGVPALRHRLKQTLQAGRPPARFTWAYHAHQLQSLTRPTGVQPTPSDFEEYWLEDWVRAWAELASGAKVETYLFPGILRIRSLLEMHVGPYVPSSGPGPFLDLPAQASPLLGRDWARSPGLRGLGQDLEDVAFFFLSPSQAAEVLSALPEQPLSRPPGWGLDGEPTQAPWLPYSGLGPEWPRCRARYAALLERAAREELAVLLHLGFGDPTVEVPRQADAHQRHGVEPPT